MPIPLPKYSTSYRRLARDVRPLSERVAEYWSQTNQIAMVAFSLSGFFVAIQYFYLETFGAYTDLIAIVWGLYFWWAYKRPFSLPFKMPRCANLPDPRNPAPGKPGAGKSEGIMYLGNTTDPDNPNCGQEIWFTNNDVRTHILYLGTTGSGKTEGLKALVTNALSWGSGYVYVDGKADTDLWASLYAVARRFGRDDDVLLINYMTGNSDDGSTSNTMNPFSNGSSSYLANMVSGFMPDAGGDNAMWKERAVALLFALMPALTYKRDHGGLLMDIGTVRDNIELQPIIRLSRDPTLPERIVHGLTGYLSTLPGYVDAAFDDEGNEKPPSPDQPMYDLQIARQQHGYLSMQFTRSLQMLADEYHYIFKAQLADVEVIDVVLNRRILITLIPALEKSGDEASNLGKIVAQTLKGMMGATLGNTVEGSWETAINSKQTRSSSSFMTVFDEVGYYTAQGMAVMAAQARSLGFSLVFAAQDIPSMEKRIKQEARSIAGNCNIKIFGRLEDPTDTKEFLTKHAGTFWVMETGGLTARPDSFASTFMNQPFYDNNTTSSVQQRARIDYDHIRDQREGEITLTFAELLARGRMFFVTSEKVKALRMHRFLPIPQFPTTSVAARDRAMSELLSRLKDESWTAKGVAPAVTTNGELVALTKGMALGKNSLECAVFSFQALHGVAVSRTTTVVTSDDDFDNPAAQKNKAGTKTGSGGTSKPTQREAPPQIPSITSGDSTAVRATLPPLYEGDQYSIVELEAAPAGTGSVPATAFATMDNDFSIVTPVSSSGGDDLDFASTQLPNEIAAIIAESARKLNKGLGAAKNAKDENVSA